MSEKSEELEVLVVGVVPPRGDDAGLASQASDLYIHTGPPPEKGVECCVLCAHLGIFSHF